MGTRLALHALLLTIAENVYYQPPSSDELNYPCIIYHKDDFDMKYANNLLYIGTNRYRLKIISKEPDCAIVKDIIKQPLCAFDVKYSVSNLNHEVYTLYY